MTQETKPLYLDDSYKKECNAVVVDVISVSDATVSDITNTQYIVLDQTVFYPRGGGQPSDTGTIEFEGKLYDVIEVTKREGRILHKINTQGLPELKRNQHVHGKIDWDKRYTLMRMHTAGHLIDAVLYRDGKIMVTGNDLGVDKSRIDFNIPDFSMDKVQGYIHEANKIISEDAEVKNYYLPREEALTIPGIVKLAGALPPDISILRITEIVGLDVQADGGTHVKSLNEIGKINILGIENKGRERKRICYTLIR
jgi:Ser-tRNA(Ala) deacylase AlaX